MSAGGCVKKVFLIFNFIFWLVGMILLGYVGWVVGTMPDITEFLSGTLIFTYCLGGLGALIALIGFFGCLAGCCESICILKTYIALMVFMLLIDVGLAAGGYAQRNQLPEYIGQFWTESNQDAKNHIQKQLSCCGYENATIEYTSIPSTCLSNISDDTSIFTDPCKDALSLWLSTNIPVWAGILGTVGLVQILSAIHVLTCSFIEDRARVKPGFD